MYYQIWASTIETHKLMHFCNSQEKKKGLVLSKLWMTGYQTVLTTNLVFGGVFCFVCFASFLLFFGRVGVGEGWQGYKMYEGAGAVLSKFKMVTQGHWLIFDMENIPSCNLIILPVYSFSDFMICSFNSWFSFCKCFVVFCALLKKNRNNVIWINYTECHLYNYTHLTIGPSVSVLIRNYIMHH